MPISAEPKRLLIVRAGESLPTASVEFFLTRAVVQASSANDKEYVCLLTAAGTYAWTATTLLAGTDYPKPEASWFTPPGPSAIDAATVTTTVSQDCMARYLGYTTGDVTSVTVVVRVTTAVATAIVYAELALASAASIASPSLTYLTHADVSSTFASTGTKSTTFAVSIPAGTHVFLLGSSSATTPFQLRATPGNEFGNSAPFVMHKTSTRPSTMAANSTFATDSGTTYAMYAAFHWR